MLLRVDFRLLLRNSSIKKLESMSNGNATMTELVASEVSDLRYGYTDVVHSLHKNGAAYRPPRFFVWIKRARRLWHACLYDKTKTRLMAEASNRHLTLVQRCKIEARLSSGHSYRVIAVVLGVVAS